jgi:hypothetical protein
MRAHSTKSILALPERLADVCDGAHRGTLAERPGRGSSSAQ